MSLSTVVSAPRSWGGTDINLVEGTEKAPTGQYLVENSLLSRTAFVKYEEEGPIL